MRLKYSLRQPTQIPRKKVDLSSSKSFRSRVVREVRVPRKMRQANPAKAGFGALGTFPFAAGILGGVLGVGVSAILGSSLMNGFFIGGATGVVGLFAAFAIPDIVDFFKSKF